MSSIRETARTVIFEADTPAGRFFDVLLIIAILLSVIVVMLDSVAELSSQYGQIFYALEWAFTLIFLVEYCFRLWCIEKPWAYVRSFYGVVDLFGFLPTLLSLWFVGAQYFLVIRVLRVLRVFRVLKMARYVGEAELIAQALTASRRKIIVFIACTLALMMVFGSFMYLVEGQINPGFASIPHSIYWAVATMTTVGYGDIVPITGLGQAVASLIMIMGYGIIAVPTGIVTLELNEANRRQANTKTCGDCSAEGHSREASYCWRCGANLYRRESAVEEGDPMTSID